MSILAATDYRFVVVPPSGRVREAFDTSGLSLLLGAVPTLEDAHRQGATSLRSFARLGEIEQRNGRAVGAPGRACAFIAASFRSQVIEARALGGDV